MAFVVNMLKMHSNTVDEPTFFILFVKSITKQKHNSYSTTGIFKSRPYVFYMSHFSPYLPHARAHNIIWKATQVKNILFSTRSNLTLVRVVILIITHTNLANQISEN